MARLVTLATIDWMDIGALVGKVRVRLGADAPFADKVRAMGELAGVLIDHDIVPGDLGADPDFRPWPGTRQERVDRIVREAMNGTEMPWPGEIAWFHRVPRTEPPTDRTDGGSSPRLPSDRSGSEV